MWGRFWIRSQVGNFRRFLLSKSPRGDMHGNRATMRPYQAQHAAESPRLSLNQEDNSCHDDRHCGQSQFEVYRNKRLDDPLVTAKPTDPALDVSMLWPRLWPAERCRNCYRYNMKLYGCGIDSSENDPMSSKILLVRCSLWFILSFLRPVLLHFKVVAEIWSVRVF